MSEPLPQSVTRLLEPDTHVTRSGDDYAEAMQALLPLGQAWPRQDDSVLMRVVRGLTRIWGDFEIRASHLLEQESDPRITIELLPDWERNWGLPDPCYEEPQSIAERQFALVQRMTIEGAQSREFFIEVAASIGYTISITEYRPFFIAMDGCGDCRQFGAGVTSDHKMRNQWGQPILNARGDQPVTEGLLSEWPNYGLGPLENRYYWTVHVDKAKLVWFRCSSGQCGVDPHLRIGTADDLECLLNRWKPAHTEIIFDYSGMTSEGDMFVTEGARDTASMTGDVTTKVLTYRSHAESGSDLTTYTFAAQPIGPAAADRRVHVGVGGAVASGSRTITSVVIGGVTATSNQQSVANTGRVGIFTALVPSGTTADVVVTWNAALIQCGIAVWSSTGLPSNNAFAADTGTNTAGGADINCDVATMAGGFILAYGIHQASTGGALTWTPAAITNRFWTAIEGSVSHYAGSGAGDGSTYDVRTGSLGTSNVNSTMVSVSF